MEPEPVAEPSPAPASERPVRAAAQKAAQKKAEEAEAAAKKKAASGKATAAALQKKLAAQKEAASAAEAAQKARIEELEAELLRQQARAAEAGASPWSAYGTPAKGQGHVSGENDNLEVELEAALGDEGEGAGEGASAPEPSPETEPPKTSQAVFDLVAANAARYSELDYNQIVLLRKHEEGEGLIEFAKGEIEKLDKKAERLRQEAREEAKEKAAFEQAEALRRAQVEQTELFRTELTAIKEAHAAQIKELKDQVAGKKTIKDVEVEGREFVVSDPGNTFLHEGDKLRLSTKEARDEAALKEPRWSTTRELKQHAAVEDLDKLYEAETNVAVKTAIGLRLDGLKKYLDLGRYVEDVVLTIGKLADKEFGDAVEKINSGEETVYANLKNLENRTEEFDDLARCYNTLTGCLENLIRPECTLQALATLCDVEAKGKSKPEREKLIRMQSAVEHALHGDSFTEGWDEWGDRSVKGIVEKLRTKQREQVDAAIAKARAGQEASGFKLSTASRGRTSRFGATQTSWARAAEGRGAGSGSA